MKTVATVFNAIKGKIGLNVEAAARKYLLEISSFKADFEYLDTINEFVIGRYENNPDNYVVFTDRGIRIVQGESETFVCFNQLLYASVPVLEAPNWVALIKSNRKVRTIDLILTTGEVFSIPVLNETIIQSFHPEAEPAEFQSLDIFQVLRFLNKVAFFQNKRRRQSDRIAVAFAVLAAVFACIYLMFMSRAHAETFFGLSVICLIAWLYIALYDYIRKY